MRTMSSLQGACLWIFALGFATMLGRAADWQLRPFVKADAVNPILTPDAKSEFDCPLHGRVKWEEAHVFNPAAIVREDKVW